MSYLPSRGGLTPGQQLAAGRLLGMATPIRPGDAGTDQPQPRSPHAPAAACDRPRRSGESAVDWAIATGRIDANNQSHWREGEEQIGAQRMADVITGVFASADDAQARRNSTRTRAAGVDEAYGAPVVQNALRRPVSAATGRNPLVEQARADGQSGQGAVPTLFPGGDLPAFTASGIDPKLLLQVPWQARHPMAAAATTGLAYRILHDASGPDAESWAAVQHGGHPANRDYEWRVRQWQAAKPLTEAEMNQLFGDRVEKQLAEANRRRERDLAPERAAARARSEKVAADIAAERARQARPTSQADEFAAWASEWQKGRR